jgi:hypothetical protein
MTRTRLDTRRRRIRRLAPGRAGILGVMARRPAQLLIAALILFTSAGALFATKPCQSSPCQAPSGELDRPKCEQVAKWIAVGVISRVEHHREGPPLLKDFARFTFRVQRWEKGTGKVGQEFRFKVGWCDNQQELPKDTSGLFRFFGAASSADGEPRYFFFERLTAP